jgi:hypothetical protein
MGETKIERYRDIETKKHRDRADNKKSRAMTGSPTSRIYKTIRLQTMMMMNDY